MAQRTMDNGRDDGRTANVPPRPTGGPGDVTPSHRSADVAPPGSRERAESDISGWNPSRDEEPSARQGRFHRAASLRMAQPRTDMRDSDVARGDRTVAYGRAPSPYGRDDRDDRYATGFGPDADQGEDVRELSQQSANYRPWDRTGYGGEEPMRGPRVEPYRDERSRLHEGRLRPEDRMRGDRTRGEDLYREGMRTGMREERGQYYTARSSGADLARADRTATAPGPRADRRRWEREPLTAREIMTRGVRTARRDTSLRELAQLMMDEDCGVVPIVDEQQRLVGLVTDRDLALRAFTGGRSPEQLRAGDVMTDDVEAVTPEESIHGVIDLMGRRQVRRVPVVERDDRLVGIIAMGDIAHRADYDEELQDALDRISSKRSFWNRFR